MKKVLFGLAATLAAAGIFSAAYTPKAAEATAVPTVASAQASQKWEYKITDSKEMGSANQIEPSTL